MEDLFAGERAELFRAPSEEIVNGGRDVMEVAMKALEHDDVVGAFSQNAESRLAGSEVELEAVSLCQHHLHDVEDDHADQGEELESEGARGEGFEVGEQDGSVA